MLCSCGHPEVDHNAYGCMRCGSCDAFGPPEETFAVEFLGGPLAGRTFMCGPWPMPVELGVDTPVGSGTYVKLSESQVPPHPNIMRGVVYTWAPSEGVVN